MATGRVRPGWTPASTNSAGQYSFGVDVVSDVDQAIEAIWWYQPATGTVTDLDVGFYRQSDQQLMRFGLMDQGDVVQGQWNKVMLDSPFVMLGGTTYTAKVSAAGEHAYDLDAGYPEPDDPAVVQFILGRYDEAATGYPISDTWGGQHGIDIEMIEMIANGTFDIILPAIQLSLAGTAPATGALDIGLPPLTMALSGSAPAAGVLDIQLPPVGLQMAGEAIATGTLGITLPPVSLVLSGEDGALAGSLREYVWRELKSDAGLNALGITEDSLFASTGPDSPDITIPATLQKWMVIRWGIEEARLGRDCDVRRRFLSIWGYDRQRYLANIDEMLNRAREVLYPLKAVQFSSSGWITEVTDNGLSDDTWDTAYAASTRNWQLTIVASGV